MRVVKNTARALGIVASVVLWSCLVVRFLKSCAASAATERRRYEEAKMLVELVCSNVEGATLAHEFARCEEASMLVKSATVSALRVADRAMANMVVEVVDMAKQGAVATAQLAVAGALLLHAPAAFFSAFGQQREARQAEMYSAMARSRMARALDIGDAFDVGGASYFKKPKFA
jgi:hypothetical protein